MPAGTPSLTWISDVCDQQPSSAGQTTGVTWSPSATVTGMIDAGAYTVVDWWLSAPSASPFPTVRLVPSTNRPAKSGSLVSVVVPVASIVSPWLVPPSLDVAPVVLASKRMLKVSPAVGVVNATVTETDLPAFREPRVQYRLSPVFGQEPLGVTLV